MIAREVVRTVVGPTAALRSVRARPIPVGVSVRHVHLSRADCDALFGAGYEPWVVMILPPGGFLTLGIILLVLSWWHERRAPTATVR